MEETFSIVRTNAAINSSQNGYFAHSMILCHFQMLTNTNNLGDCCRGSAPLDTRIKAVFHAALAQRIPPRYSNFFQLFSTFSNVSPRFSKIYNLFQPFPSIQIPNNSQHFRVPGHPHSAAAALAFPPGICYILLVAICCSRSIKAFLCCLCGSRRAFVRLSHDSTPLLVQVMLLRIRAGIR